MTTWMLVDGNSLTYRAFFALPTDIATSSGQVTNAVYGFTSMLVNLVRDHRPDRLVVAFDLPEPTFRHEQVPTYKAQRDETPDILVEQMGLVREVAEAFGAQVVEAPGYEADDVLATLATQAARRGDDAWVVTGDRDAFQLVADPHVSVLYTQARGVSELKAYDEAGVRERTGVAPSDYVTYAALRGDPSDNLPGVPGVGEKKAAKLVNDYGDVDAILAAAGDQTPKLAENLAASAEVVRSNAEIMALVRDVPGVDLGDVPAPEVDPVALNQLMGFLEFRSGSLRRRLDEAVEALGATPVAADSDTGDDANSGAMAAPAVAVAGDAATAAKHLGGLTGAGVVVAAASFTGDDAWPPAPVGVALGAGDGDGVAEVVWLPGAVLDDDAVVAALADLLGAGGPALWCHEARDLLGWLATCGLEVRSLAADTGIAAYLLDPAAGTYPLAGLVGQYLGVEYATGDEPAAAGQLDLGVGDDAKPGDTAGANAAREVAAIHALVPALSAAMEARGLGSLYADVEIPLVWVLASMEATGIRVDLDVLRQLHDDLSARATHLAAEVQRDAGSEFNVNSTPQLRKVLFEDLGLTPQRKTKTGYSTDAASLEKLLGEHPIVEHLLAYREVEKLRSTYGQGLIDAVAPDGRIHATFSQTATRTGRISSENPNLHNIPVRTELGQQFRRAFVASAGSELVVADYNQIELRVIAHLAEDPGLIAAFTEGADIHNETAARVFGVDTDAVEPAMRAKAKMVSYGLAYGMEAYGLAQRLAIEVPEAQEILDAYFEAFPAVADYMERTVAEARQRGYTETLFGRRRPIPELSSPNARLRQAGERQAMNAGIQGLAADIFKVALVRIDAALPDAVGSRLILQVHDEVLVECPPDAVGETSALVRDAMTGAFELRVPLEVHLATGHSWADAKG